MELLGGASMVGWKFDFRLSLVVGMGDCDSLVELKVCFTSSMFPWDFVLVANSQG